MHTIVYILAAVAVVTGLVSTISVMPAINGQNETEVPAIAPANETLQEGENITITAAENETATPPAATNETQAEPVNATEEQPAPGEPEVLTTPGEEGPFNITAVQEPEEATITVSLASLTEGSNNVTIIEPDGNVTEIPDVNVTQVDNDTVVIAPPVENVTTIPETNVTVITPAPEECACPAPNATEPEPLAPVIVEPAPGQQVTIKGGEVTVENQTGVVVEGTDNATQPSVEPPEQPQPEQNATGSAGNSSEVSPASFSNFVKWFTV